MLDGLPEAKTAKTISQKNSKENLCAFFALFASLRFQRHCGK
jgi:hypothetical protein